ncbi:ceramide kinase [Orycteropus afer afer]|uniref:Ceramide kinase n=1 Tax=Orycteropus afer afer TaxID=1230840 RepID=A0A8B7B6S1_ORYAF|nr:ceramide kinase [Orycteropus afer afer]
MEKPHGFTVHCVKRARRHRWKWAQVTFWCPEEQLCTLWLQTLRELLGRLMTEHANHAKESLYEMNIDKYDGVVCVGGDGMFSEVLHGLIGRTQQEAGVDQNHPRATLVPSPLRIGIIPAGSTDCVCYSTVGTNDAETSALHIVIGDSLPMDVSSVHHNGALLRYSVSLLGYGFYGDIIKDSEKKRWMGLVRYDFSGFKTFLSHHYYEGTVSFLLAQHTVGSPRDRKPCRAGCFVCRQSKQQLDEEQKKSLYGLESAEEVEEWKVVCGKFLAINATNMSCACPRSPRGLSTLSSGWGPSDLEVLCLTLLEAACHLSGCLFDQDPIGRRNVRDPEKPGRPGAHGFLRARDASSVSSASVRAHPGDVSDAALSSGHASRISASALEPYGRVLWSGQARPSWELASGVSGFVPGPPGSQLSLAPQGAHWPLRKVVGRLPPQRGQSEAASPGMAQGSSRLHFQPWPGVGLPGAAGGGACDASAVAVCVRRVHCQLVRLFARGIEENPKQASHG